MSTINATNNVMFRGDNTKKTPRGNEYQITHMARTTGGAVGLVSGALVSHIASKDLKTNAGKRMFIQSLNNMGKSLNALGPVKVRKNHIKTGAAILMTGIVALGMFVGAAIGGTIDSHNNHNRAKEADKTAKV